MILFSFAKRSIPTGTFNIPETAVPANTHSLQFDLGLCTTADPTIWPNVSTTVDIALEVSYDNKATWVGGGGASGIQGGIHLMKDGVTEQTQGGFIAGFTNSPTHARGTVVVTNGPLVTFGSVQAF